MPSIVPRFALGRNAAISWRLPHNPSARGASGRLEEADASAKRVQLRTS
ncbi:TPA: hypothetical protein N0F65_009975 [Lagenidium giganteum]|uniref:Uncharacterized protein n=1 Tax=Lagenidium giganteum TaxID=4803 RepID=A0AAV2YR54_9STRA|nr:TPA: hypothetical protein N0F65_009975 [Lagenidium giganteum]